MRKTDKAELEKSTLEYTAPMGGLVWSIPVVHNVTGNLSRGIAVIEISGVLKAYAVSKDYSLTLLIPKQTEKLRFAWEQITKVANIQILAIGAKNALSESKLRKALFESNVLGGKEYVKSKTKDDEKEKSRRQFFDLQHKMPFGKHKGLTVKEIIDNHPGWITWALREINDGFLNAPARKYYNDKLRDRAKKIEKKHASDNDHN